LNICLLDKSNDQFIKGSIFTKSSTHSLSLSLEYYWDDWSRLSSHTFQIGFLFNENGDDPGWSTRPQVRAKLLIIVIYTSNQRN
jgi:hypothetical protein